MFFSNQRESVIDSVPDAKSTFALTSSPQLGEWFCGERVASTCSITDLRLNHSTAITTTTYTKMVYLDTMEEWQRQAKLLFQARPATVRKSTTHRLLAGQQR